MIVIRTTFNTVNKTFRIEGMTCMGCVNSVKTGLKSESGIKDVLVDLESGTAKIEMDRVIPLETLQLLIGHYKISPLNGEMNAIDEDLIPEVNTTTYRPLILIILFISGVTLLAQFPFNEFSAMRWMRHFMAGFFIVFSFFKLLNVQGFAQSYSMYDIVASKWKPWGYIYPFIELTLGILYLTNIAPYYTNLATILILGISSIGVIQSNLNKQKIKCACLGNVFNLPMSTVTIIEDLTMVAMAVIMLAV